MSSPQAAAAARRSPRGSVRAPRPRERSRFGVPPHIGALGATALFAVLTVAALVIALSDVLTPDTVRPRPMLMLLPIVAALSSSLAGTGLIVAVTIAVVMLVEHIQPYYLSAPSYFVYVAGTGALALLVACLRDRQRRHLSAVHSAAEAAQNAVMRPPMSRVRNLRVAHAYLPSAEAASVGGDWYDLQPSPHGVRAVIGDVSGHGLHTVATATALLGSFHENAYHERELSVVAERLDVRMQRQNVWARITRGERQDKFATALLLDFGDEYVDIVNFGHVPPLLLRDGRVRPLDPEPGPPLGMGDLADGPPPVRRVPFAVGDMLVLVTDGVTESRDRDGVFYPLAARLPGLAAAAAGPDALRDALTADLAAFRRSGIADDTAVLIIQRTADVHPLPDDAEAQALYGTNAAWTA